MNIESFETLLKYLIDQAILSLKNTSLADKIPVDFVNVFSKTDQEFEMLLELTESIGKKIESDATVTGTTFLLNKVLETSSGPLSLVRIRKPDPTRPQRGAVDFRISNYEAFKKECLSKNSGNYTLLIRTGFELVEIKGVDVLVYTPNIPMTKQLGL